MNSFEQLVLTVNEMASLDSSLRTQQAKQAAMESPWIKYRVDVRDRFLALSKLLTHGKIIGIDILPEWSSWAKDLLMYQKYHRPPYCKTDPPVDPGKVNYMVSVAKNLVGRDQLLCKLLLQVDQSDIAFQRRARRLEERKMRIAAPTPPPSPVEEKKEKKKKRKPRKQQQTAKPQHPELEEKKEEAPI